MMEILIFILGLFVGFILTVMYFVKRFKNVNSLFEDKLLINDLLKEQIKTLQAKKSKKYYRRNVYKKNAAKAGKQ